MAAGDRCDLCEGTGMWGGGCDPPRDCWQCHGTGCERARGNCAPCLGWGMSVGGVCCESCGATGWVDRPHLLYWCADCGRTVAAAATNPECPSKWNHDIARVSGSRPSGGQAE